MLEGQQLDVERKLQALRSGRPAGWDELDEQQPEKELREQEEAKDPLSNPVCEQHSTESSQSTTAAMWVTNGRTTILA